MAIQFNNAVRSKNRRQRYLDETFTGKIPNCTKVYYDPDCDELKKFSAKVCSSLKIPQEIIDIALESIPDEDYTARVFYKPILIGIMEKMPIFVGRKSFSEKYDEEKIKWNLEAHEARHIMQARIGFPDYFNTEAYIQACKDGEIDPRISILFGELDADLYGYAQAKIGKFNLNESYLYKIANTYNRNKQNLFNSIGDPSTTDIAREFVGAFLRNIA